MDLTDTESSGYALSQAARIAKRIPTSELHIVQVLAAGADADRTREAAGCLERYASAKATELGGLARRSVGIHVRSGQPGHGIPQLAHDVKADLVIVGVHRRLHLKGFSSARLRST